MTVKYHLLVMTNKYRSRHDGFMKKSPTRSSTIEITVWSPEEMSPYRLNQLIYNALRDKTFDIEKEVEITARIS